MKAAVLQIQQQNKYTPPFSAPIEAPPQIHRCTLPWQRHQQGHPQPPFLLSCDWLEYAPCNRGAGKESLSWDMSTLIHFTFKMHLSDLYLYYLTCLLDRWIKTICMKRY